MAEPIKITINGQEVDTEKGARLIDVCRENGVGIPSFCYYKDLALQSSCRMCLVRIEKMPKLQTSCTITCTDGMVVTTVSEEVEKAQRAMGEFLLANHPLDCPQCDRGGECELQEVIFDWGDVEERFFENKNVAPEKYLSPVIANDPQRCILCKRCTRVCDEWMGEDAIEAANRGVQTVIGTYGGWLNCSQCGNCVEVCPTGTLLDAVYRHETRPWELEQIISTDVYGSDGMQISIGARGGKVHRVVARDRYVDGLNGEFLDVKARYAHGFINHEDRIKTPLIRYTKGGKLIPATWDEAIRFAAKGLADAGSEAAVIASPRLTNESIFALKEFAANAAKSDRVAVSDPFDLRPIFENLSVELATHAEIRKARAIVQIGGEPEEEQTFTAKQVRQAVRNDGAAFICVNDTPTNLSRRATHFVHTAPGTADAFVLALLDSGSIDAAAQKMAVDAGEVRRAIEAISSATGDVVLMFGEGISAEAQKALAAGAAKLSGEGRRVLLHPLARYNNSVGANDILSKRKSVADALKGAKAALVAGSLQDAKALEGVGFVVVQELFLTETAQMADVVLPAASFAEVDGTFTNNAGNPQRVRKAIEPVDQARADWLITAQISREMGTDILQERASSAIFRQIAKSVAAYEGLTYPAIRDERTPVQAKYPTNANPVDLDGLRKAVDAMQPGEKIKETPRIGHKLHRLTTMTSKTPQFHLLNHGNPKPANLMVAPLVQLNLDGSPKEEGIAEAAGVSASDRSIPKN